MMMDHTMVTIFFLVLESLWFGKLIAVEPLCKRSFVVDYTEDVFMKDCRPFHYISGSVHYFRTPPAYWRDRLKKCRAAGLNAISTYVEWSSHEPNPGDYQFTDINDIERFIQLAAEEDLLVILRSGPFICAERDFGGLPSWLLTKHPNMVARTDDADYQDEVKKWLDVLFGRLGKYLYGNGGPIIMVQVENHYGGFEELSEAHKIWLRDELRRHVGDAAVLFTVDTPERLKLGKIAGVLPTIAFGSARNPYEAFAKMRKLVPHGPLVNAEFYIGWLSYWGRPRERVGTARILRSMKQMLDMKANLNFYMFAGGTNFGFTSGASYDESWNKYYPQLTSYDYDAPLDEAGDPTYKYLSIRQAIHEYHKLPNITLPKRRPKGKYGKVKLKPLTSALDNANNKVLQKSPDPKTFESLDVRRGYVLYETTVPDNVSGQATLDVMDLRDRATVYVDQVFVKVIDRSSSIHSVSLSVQPGQTIRLLVENQGRISFGNFKEDFKGLLSTPRLNDLYLTDWTMTSLPLEDISWASTSSPAIDTKIVPPAFYVGEFVLPSSEEPLDTYVDMSDWRKGVIYINDVNLGRYWPAAGSQITLYVPGCYLRPSPQKNSIVVFETEHAPFDRVVKFTEKPILDRTILYRVRHVWSN